MRSFDVLDNSGLGNPDSQKRGLFPLLVISCFTITVVRLFLIGVLENNPVVINFNHTTNI